MKIEIDSKSVESRTFPDKNDSTKQNTMYSQSAYLHKQGKRYPEEFQFTVDKNGIGEPMPLDPGVYNVDPEKIIVIGKYKSLDVAKYDIYQILQGSAFTSMDDIQKARAKKSA